MFFTIIITYYYIIYCYLSSLTISISILTVCSSLFLYMWRGALDNQQNQKNWVNVLNKPSTEVGQNTSKYATGEGLVVDCCNMCLFYAVFIILFTTHLRFFAGYLLCSSPWSEKTTTGTVQSGGYTYPATDAPCLRCWGKSCESCLWCRRNELLKLWGASMNKQMVVETRVKWHEHIHAQLTEWINHWINEKWVGQSMNQWFSESMIQWIIASINESMIQWITEWVNYCVDESMNQWTNDAANQRMDMGRWINEPMHQRIDDSVNQWTVN